MVTLKRRINISVDRNTELTLTRIAKRDSVPIATKAAELLRFALEIEEDIAFATIVEERMKYKGKGIPHKLVWK